MADLRLVLIQARAQLLSTVRNRRAMVLGLVVPAVLMVLFNSILVGSGDAVNVAGARVTGRAYVAGGMLAYAIIGTAFITPAMSLIAQRETGQLKRYRGTPVPVWTFVAALVARVAALVAVAAVLMLTLARLAYGVHVSGQALAEIAVYVLLGAATLCSAGIAVTAIATDVDTASAALPLVAVLLSFISSIFVSVDQLPAWLAEIGRLFPVYHVAVGVQTALGAAGDTSLHPGDIAVLAAWAVASALVAVRHFRWEPQAATA